MMSAIAKWIIVVFGIFFIGVGIIMLFAPKKARQILRKEVQLKDAIRQWGNIGGLVAGLLKNKIFADPDLIFKGLYAISEYNETKT